MAGKGKTRKQLEKEVVTLQNLNKGLRGDLSALALKFGALENENKNTHYWGEAHRERAEAAKNELRDLRQETADLKDAVKEADRELITLRIEKAALRRVVLAMIGERE